MDILGFKLNDGIALLNKSGIVKGDIVIKEYSSPREDIIGEDTRIVKFSEQNGKITLVVSKF